MNASLHNANINSVKVMDLETCAVVTVADENGNDVSIFLKDLTEVMFLSSRIMAAMEQARKENVLKQLQD